LFPSREIAAYKTAVSINQQLACQPGIQEGRIFPFQKQYVI
jgi:hypothetical protein